jgi:hypothetical protein
MESETQKPTPFGQLLPELKAMVGAYLDPQTAISFSQIDRATYTAVTDDLAFATTMHYEQILNYLSQKDPPLLRSVIEGLSKGLPTQLPKLSAVQGENVFDALSAAALAIQNENCRARAIGSVAVGLGAVEDAEQRLERFDQLKNVALNIQNNPVRADVIGGLAAGLGAIENAGIRLERFDQLKNIALNDFRSENRRNLTALATAISVGWRLA